MDLNIRIAGEAGQGVLTTGNVLVGALAQTGLYVLSTKSYMSRIRGGLNWFDIRIADEPLFAGRQRADLLVALTDSALDALKGHVTENSVVVHDGSRIEGVIGIDLNAVAKDAGGTDIMSNTVAAGCVFGLLGYDIDLLCDFLENRFSKDSDTAAKNASCARRGAELIGEQHRGVLRPPAPADAPCGVISGAEAIGMSAAASGIKLAASYPMSPSTGVFTVLAAAADEYGIVVEQAESEIAAINMVCGAAYAGAPAMTTTSGGGFALMCEGLSLAGIMELPAVIVLAQRPGPATGLPTRTGQEDLKFAVNGGHGEFARIVIAPGTIEQAHLLTRHAIEMAHKHQTPAIILVDQYLVDMQKNLPEADNSYRPIDRCVVEAGEGYLRYALTDSGISPRAIPGGAAPIVSDSDEHTTDGHLTEDLVVRIEQVDKRLRKLDGLLAEALAPERYGPEDAETLLICWGSAYGPAREAVDLINKQGGAVASLHFAQPHPLNIEAARRAIGSPERIVCVEGNATGQFASILRQAGVIGQCDLMSRYDGLPFTGEEIARRLDK